MSSIALTGPAGDLASPIHALDPRAKVLGFLTVTCVAVSAPLGAWPVYAGCAVALAVLAALAGVPAGTVWKRARLVLLLVLFVALFVPFANRDDGLAVFAEVAAKATLGTVSAVLLGATTSYPEVLRALEALKVPRAFTLIAAFAYRYLFVIAGEVRRMRAAVAARGHRPRTALGASALGRLAAALFLRSHARGERVYLAMLARGYAGSMPQPEPLAFRRADVAFVAAVAVTLVALRIWVEL